MLAVAVISLKLTETLDARLTEQAHRRRLSGDGMVAEIAENKWNVFLSIRHLGFIAHGVEDTTSEAVQAWAPAYENYTFLAVPDGTMMLVDQDVSAEWVVVLSDAWPKALELLKKL